MEEHKEHIPSHTSETKENEKKKYSLSVNGFKEKIFDNRKTIFLLIIIFLLGVSIRANLVRYDGNYLFEPDAFYHARLVQEIVTQGYVSPIDQQNYYQIEGGIGHQPASIYHYINAFVYFVFGFGQPFNKELLSFIVQFLPCIFGGLIALGMYFLAKEVFNSKKIGYVAAFLAAVTPAFVYRTMAGAQGDNSLGFLWMVVGFYFFVKAVKTKTINKKDLINAVLGGIFFAFMAMTWDVYLLIPMIIIPYFIFAVILIASESRKEEFKRNEVIHFSGKVLLSLFVMSLFSFLPITSELVRNKTFWLFSIAGSVAAPLKIDPMIVVGLVLVLTFVGIGIAYFISKTGKETKKIVETLAIFALILGIITMLGIFFIEPDFFYRDGGRLGIGSMVGEESVGNNFFGTKYNALIVLPWFAILLFPIGLYFFKKEDSHTQLIFFFWTIITLFMAWYKLKFSFIFGLGLVAGAALTFYIVFETLKKLNIEKGLEAKSTLVALVFLLLLGVGSSAIFVPDYAPFPNQDTKLIELMNWIDNNTQKDAKFFNWWNEGHLLAFETERRFSADNRNEGNSNKYFSEFAVTTDTQKGYEIASKTIGADYIYLDSSMVYSMGTFEYYVADKIDSRLVQKYYKGQFTVLSCEDRNEIVVCGQNTIPKTNYLEISPTWKNVPDAFPDGTNPAYYYRTNNEVFIVNEALNNTNFMKVLMNSEETKDKYEIAYENNGIYIIKIKK